MTATSGNRRICRRSSRATHLDNVQAADGGRRQRHREASSRRRRRDEEPNKAIKSEEGEGSANGMMIAMSKISERKKANSVAALMLLLVLSATACSPCDAFAIAAPGGATAMRRRSCTTPATSDSAACRHPASSAATALFARKARSGGGGGSKKKKPPSSAAAGFGASSSKSKSGSSSSAAKNTRSLSSIRGSGAGSKVLRKAANAFDAIRKRHEGSGEGSVAECCRDVYVRSPKNSPTTFWFVGKVAFEPGTAATAEHAVVAQKRLILEYSIGELRPQNFGGPYSQSLELWLAPGDSEMDVVQNKVILEKVEGSADDLPDDLDLDSIGYNPEIYVGDERTQGGLRVERDEEGRPTKPVFDVNQSA